MGIFTHQKPMAISTITSPMAMHVSPPFPSPCRSETSMADHGPYSASSSSSSSSSTTSSCGSTSPDGQKYGRRESSVSFMATEPPTPTSSTSTTVPVLRINDHHRHVSSSASSTSSTSSGSGSGDDALPMSAYPVFDAYTTNSRKNDDIGGQATLSLQERRQRNKTASARYRAKKNQQHQDMRSMIHSLTKENDVLMRQLDHVMGENQQLKINCDKLRGKIMAEKMLKKLLQQQLCTHPNAAAADMVLDDDENDELADDCAELDVNQEHYTTRPKTPENAPNDNHVSFKANHGLPTRHDHGHT